MPGVAAGILNAGFRILSFTAAVREPGLPLPDSPWASRSLKPHDAYEIALGLVAAASRAISGNVAMLVPAGRRASKVGNGADASRVMRLG